LFFCALRLLMLASICSIYICTNLFLDKMKAADAVFAVLLGPAGVAALSPFLTFKHVPATGLPSSAMSPFAAEAATAPTVYVDCANGSDSQSGATPAEAVKTLPKAVSLNPTQILVSGGTCAVTSPVVVSVDQPTGIMIIGDGKTAISGGQAISGWKAVSTQPSGSAPSFPTGVMVADVSAFPLEAIKTLRVGPTILRRSRWPKLVGSGAWISFPFLILRQRQRLPHLPLNIAPCSTPFLLTTFSAHRASLFRVRRCAGVIAPLYFLKIWHRTVVTSYPHVGRTSAKVLFPSWSTKKKDTMLPSV
jgi:hypothetical protein